MLWPDDLFAFSPTPTTLCEKQQTYRTKGFIWLPDDLEAPDVGGKKGAGLVLSADPSVEQAVQVVGRGFQRPLGGERR